MARGERRTSKSRSRDTAGESGVDIKEDQGSSKKFNEDASSEYYGNSQKHAGRLRHMQI